jgi:YVTN family beta-propeller protein
MRRDLWNAVVDVKSCNIIASAKTGDEPEGVTIRPDGKVVYVTSERDGDGAAIDTTTNAVLKRIPVGHRPRGIGFLPDGSRAFGRLFFVDPAKNQPSGSIAVGQRPWGVGLMPDGRTLYTANGPSNDVSVVKKFRWASARGEWSCSIRLRRDEPCPHTQ